MKQHQTSAAFTYALRADGKYRSACKGQNTYSVRSLELYWTDGHVNPDHLAEDKSVSIILLETISTSITPHLHNDVYQTCAITPAK